MEKLGEKFELPDENIYFPNGFEDDAKSVTKKKSLFPWLRKEGRDSWKDHLHKLGIMS